jgi:hypothetical protein
MSTNNQNQNVTLFEKQILNFTDNNAIENSRTLFIVYIVFFILIISVFISFDYMIKEKDILEQDALQELFLIVLPIFLFIGYFTLFYKSNQSKFKSFIILFLFIFITVGLKKFYDFFQSFTKKNDFVKKYSNYFFIGIVVIVVLFGLSIVSSIAGEKLRRMKGFTGFFINFIFFIPCLITDFFKYIKKEFNLTPSVTYIILFFQIILLLIYIYLPRLFQQKLITNGTTIVNEPLFLDIEPPIYTGIENKFEEPAGKEVANIDDIPRNEYLKREVNDPDENEFFKNYSISLWIYLNDNIKSEIPKHIFSYGSKDDFKPKIEYLGVSDLSNKTITDPDYDDYSESKGKLRITISKCSVTDNNFYEKCDDNGSIFVDMTIQKWNNLVFNYTENGVDLFLNGDLVNSINFGTENNFPSYNPNDKFRVGDHKDLKGAICNVSYFSNVLTTREISTYYNLLFFKNPPVNNII